MLWLYPVSMQVVAYDFGIKHNILRRLASYGCSITVVPADYPADKVMDLNPDGVFFSNGPVSGHAQTLQGHPDISFKMSPDWSRETGMVVQAFAGDSWLCAAGFGPGVCWAAVGSWACVCHIGGLLQPLWLYCWSHLCGLFVMRMHSPAAHVMPAMQSVAGLSDNMNFS